jgi:hypothetical protein
MKTRYFALMLGVAFLVLGILGFVPQLLSPSPADEVLRVGASYGLLFGLFPVNALLDLLHLAFGVWGVVVWRSFIASRVYSRSVAVIFAIITVMGFFPLLRTTFGLMPLFGHDIWLHAVIAMAAGYFGYAPVAEVEAGSGATMRRP